MKTVQISTRFMTGYKDVEGEIFSILCSEYNMNDVLDSRIADEDAIYSAGFIHAIESGLIPTLEVADSSDRKKEEEYHHFIIDGNCFVAYFR